MYFSIAVVLGALPFYVGAVSVQNSLRDVISIPLSKRSTFHKAGRVINTASFETSIHQTVASVLPVLFTEKTGLLTKLSTQKISARIRCLQT